MDVGGFVPVVCVDLGHQAQTGSAPVGATGSLATSHRRRSQRARHRLEVKYSLRRAPEDPKLLLVPPSLNRLFQSPIGRATQPTRPGQVVAWNLAGCFA